MESDPWSQGIDDTLSAFYQNISELGVLNGDIESRNEDCITKAWAIDTDHIDIIEQD